MFTILIVEDDKAILEMLSISLKMNDYQVLEAGTGYQALSLLNEHHPDLILLDWMLPDIDGLILIQKTRKLFEWQYIPIIMLIAKTQESDKVKGLNVRADDYMTKPVLLKELNARIHSLLRRSQGLDNDGQLTIQEISINLTQHLLQINGDTVEIGATEFRLLYFLMKNKGRVFSRSQLLDEVWGRLTVIDERTVDVHIFRLRKILKRYQLESRVQTVRNIGYRFN